MYSDTNAVSFQVLVDDENVFGIGVETEHEKFVTGPFESMAETQKRLDELVAAALESGRFAVEKVSLRVDAGAV